MLEERAAHFCLLIYDEVVVVGGAGKKSSEILNLNSQKWRRGPDLPTTIGWSVIIQAQPGSKYAAYLIGGYDSSGVSSAIYGLKQDFTKFDKVGHLKTARQSHLALPLPENIIEKCLG